MSGVPVPGSPDDIRDRLVALVRNAREGAEDDAEWEEEADS